MKDLYDLLKDISSITPQQQEFVRKKKQQLKEVSTIDELAALDSSGNLQKKLSSIRHDKLLQERILGNNNLMDIYYLHKGLEVAKTVCRIIRWPDQEEKKIPSGTGFLIGPGLLMTNNHVIPNFIKAQTLYAEFGYENTDGQQVNTNTQVFKLDPKSFFITEKKLDFAVIAVSPIAIGQLQITIDSYGWNKLKPAKDKIFDAQHLSIIQHPKGERKMIAFRENRLISQNDSILYYTTDTDRGSSGSLVANDDWDIVALHRAGVPEKDEENNILLTKNGFWQSPSDNEYIRWIANEGVLIDYILDNISQHHMSSPKQEILKNAILHP